MTQNGMSKEEQIINEDYKVWKKNTPFLYDLVMAHCLEWPSLTVQWLPGCTVDRDRGFSTQKLLLGTHTSGTEQNFLVVANVTTPMVSKDYDFDSNGVQTGKGVRVDVVQRIPHDGEVNRARYMPQNSNIVATKTVSSQVYIFDRSKHSAGPPQSAHGAVPCVPTLRLGGHTMEGYGLAFSPKQEGFLASGSDDALICVWDIAGPLKDGRKELAPLATCNGHSSVVEDVCWHPSHPNVLASVADDHTLKLWDTRTFTKPQSSVVAHPAGEVNAVHFNPFSQFVLATGSADNTAAVWDARNLKRRVHTFTCHRGEVFAVQWSPFHETILATSSADRRICFWDVERIGRPQSEEDALDGPPELLFKHAGHTSKILDLAWNPDAGKEWVMASVADDNILQVWRMATPIYTEPEPPLEVET